jgi:hypothetical protein
MRAPLVESGLSLTISSSHRIADHFQRDLILLREFFGSARIAAVDDPEVDASARPTGYGPISGDSTDAGLYLDRLQYPIHRSQCETAARHGLIDTGYYE